MAPHAAYDFTAEIQEVLAQWASAEEDGSTEDSEREAAGDMADLLSRILTAQL
ncbi:hypothetical protein [Streptomyces californicus]|uniref:hypothetical protein n=1 Tax=Streptomyces californicus TaxID=67351 RepID=UPI00296FB46D|nr:hypothetical protein [Streptomyces californicus]MDW4912592.1 hypothetical protein [Streptomyces californicus]